MEKVKILAEIEKLVDEQLLAIQGKLTYNEVVEYSRRKKRITELLERLRGNGVKAKTRGQM